MVEEPLAQAPLGHFQEPKPGAPVWATEVKVVPKAVAGNVGDGEDRELLEARFERASKTAIAGGDGAGGGRVWADFL